MRVEFVRDGGHVHSICPMCGHGDATAVLTVATQGPALEKLHLAECTACRSMHYTDDDPVIGYDFVGFEQSYWLHYVQSGAGISAMLEPLLAVADPEGGDLLDVGCGFGFIPHYWQTMQLGRAVGLETSFYGRLGKEKLGTEIYHSYYADTPEIAGVKFKYVFSSEVIEHVPDPEKFVREISEAIGDDGILILTTPSADSIAPETAACDLIAALSPGFHFFLARDCALDALLRRCGFQHTLVRNTGTRLFAWASHRPLPTIRKRFECWDSYLSYLQGLADNRDPHVAGGALYRLLKDATNLGRLAEADDIFPKFERMMRYKYQIDLWNPTPSVEAALLQRVSDNTRFPSWLGCGLLYSGLQLRRRGYPPRIVEPLLEGASRVMRFEIETGAQFAQEPAHFLPLAEKALADVHADKPVGASELPYARQRAPVFHHATAPRHKDACLLIGFAPDGTPTPGLIQLCEVMSDQGFDVHVCLAADEPDIRPDMTSLASATTVSCRKNGGYDFAAWAALLAAKPELWRSQRLVFMNDSILLARRAAFDALIAVLRDDPAEFIALTESNTPAYHVQSYFFQLQGAALCDWHIRDFWSQLREETCKTLVIQNCELKLYEIAGRSGDLRRKVLFDYQTLFPGAALTEPLQGNPTIDFWERLLLCGTPFIKAELIHSNPNRARIQHWRALLQSYGTDLSVIERHLVEMSRTRIKDRKNLPLDRRLAAFCAALVGESFFSRLRQWNRRRRARIKKSNA